MDEITPNSVARAYKRYAVVYDGLFGPVQRAGRRHLAAAVSLLAPERILEIGVGTGLTLADYPETAAVTGIDLSPDMLALAKRRTHALPDRRIALQVMDAEHMTFADASFDCVTLPYVLSVTPNPDRLVAEVRRVCRPGGHVVVVNHFSGNAFWRPAERLVGSLADRIGFRSEFDFNRNIERHDWQVVETRAVGLLNLYRLTIIRNAPR